jgi:hydroxyacylglutathione hydrolase
MMSELIQHTINTPYMIGSVHCYTGIFDGELVLFDTGPPTLDGQKYLQDHINLRGLKHVIVTHCHIDHYGQAHWLEQNSDAMIYLPYRDCLKINDHDRRLTEIYQLLSDLGFDEKYLEGLRQIFDSRTLTPPLPQKFLAAEQDLPKRLGIKVLPCPGHSQSDLVYVGEEWVVTGDTLLRGVFQSPLLDVDLVHGGRFKNYNVYCSTIVKLAGLQDKMVLPGHRQTVKSINSTLHFYISKLLQRVEQLHLFKDEENLIVLIEKLLKGRMRETIHLYLKASEIIFMKDFLQQPELLRQSLEEIDLFDDVAELYDSAIQG